MDWLQIATRTVANFIDRVPLERMLIKPRDTSKDREELKNIIQGNKLATEKETSLPPVSQPTIAPMRKPYTSGPTTQETVDYQNREIGKLLLRMERHLAQRFRVNGKACDCGQSKHLLDLESLCEETVPMVNNPNLYYSIIEWVRDVGPKATEASVISGAYDEEYSQMSHQSREFRKELIGSLDPSALWPKRETPYKLNSVRENLELPPGDIQQSPAEVTPES